MNKNMKTISNTLHSSRRKPNILSPKIYHPNQNVSYLNVNPAVSALSVMSRNFRSPLTNWCRGPYCWFVLFHNLRICNADRENKFN